MLRAYQDRMLSEILTCIDKGLNPLVVSPCGSGKTHLIAALAEARSCVAIAHRRELLEKIRSLSRDCPTYSIAELTCQQAPPTSFRHAELLIVDEAHHAVAATYRKIMSDFGGQVVGFTATPVRMDGIGLDQVFDCLVQGPSLEDLVDEGWLASFDFFTAPNAEIECGSLSTRGGRDYSVTEVEKMTAVITGGVAAHWHRLAEGRQTIVFAVSASHGQALLQEFGDAGVDARLLLHNSLDRRELVEKFRSGEFRVLINCEIAIEGIDVPSCECVQIVRPTRSLRIFDQMVGRVLRPSSSRGIVLDHGQNWLRFGHPMEPRTWSLSGAEWGGGHIRSCPSCGFCDPSSALMCPSCGHEFSRRASRRIPRMSSVDLAERAYRRLTTQEARQVADAARKKERPRVTALRLGVPLPSVLRIFREVGESIRPNATPAQKSLALEMARQGVKYPEIAKQIGVSRAAVQSWAAAAGIVRRGLPSALTTEEIAQKIRENLTQAEIKRMGATHSQIQKAIEEYGLQKRARRNKD